MSTEQETAMFSGLQDHYQKSIMRLQQTTCCAERAHLLSFCRTYHEELRPYVETANLNQVAAIEKTGLRFIPFKAGPLRLVVDNQLNLSS